MLFVVGGFFLLLLTASACNNQSAEIKEAAPVDTTAKTTEPTVDTTGMDTASTRPVKTPN